MIDPATTIGEIGERALVRHLRSRLVVGEGVHLGAGDDAAAVESPGLTLFTTDCLVEGVHFRREWSPPTLVGRKALTINLSDVAAMAGVPRFATVSLCLPPELPFAFVDGLYDGLLERAAETGVSLVGGNVAAAPCIVIDVALLGQTERLLTRSGAQPGDLVVVAGTVGAAAEGLKLLQQGVRLGADGQVESTGIWTESSIPAVGHCLRAQLDPAPPLAFARTLSEADKHDIAHAAIDLSDGLSGDLLALCELSGVAAWIDPEGVPVDPRVARIERAQGSDPLPLALHGGEDYQMLLAVPEENLDRLKDLAVVWDLPITVVGRFIGGEPGVSLRKGDDFVPLIAKSYDHFRRLRGDAHGA